MWGVVSWDAKWVIFIKQDILREREHISLIFITLYCYNCSILLVIIVNLLQWLIYKVSLSLVCMDRKTVYSGLGTICSFRHPLVGLNVSPGIRAIYCMFMPTTSSNSQDKKEKKISLSKTLHFKRLHFLDLRLTL